MIPTWAVFILGGEVLAIVILLGLNSRSLRRAIRGDDGRGSHKYDSSAELVPYRDPGQAEPEVIRIPKAEPVIEAWREMPAGREPKLESDVAVPGLQSLMVAGAVAIAVICVGLAVGWASWGKLALAAFGLALLVALLHRISFFSRLLIVSETITRTDINRDGWIGAPARSFALVNPGQARADVSRQTREERQQQQLDELVRFVERCATAGTAESAHGVMGGGGRQRYVELRDCLLALGLGAWRNPARKSSGWELTTTPDRARQVLERHVMSVR